MTYNIFNVDSPNSRMISGEINILSSELNARSYQVENFISSKLGTNERVFARRTVCEFICRSVASDFINKNHIQPLNIGKIKFAVGLFSKNTHTLLSVMTFGYHPRTGKSVSTTIVLNRLCTERGITVIGGASKLFNYFIKSDTFRNAKFNKVISWADNRLSIGKVYIAIGFIEEKIYNKDYFYAKNGAHYNKQNFRKSKIDCRLDQTERERMIELGYIRHKDLGKTRFVWSL